MSQNKARLESSSADEPSTKKMRLDEANDDDKMINQLTLQLEWLKRDKIIQSLNRYSAILYSRSISNVKEKKELAESDQDLVSDLMNLKLKPLDDGKFDVKINLDHTGDDLSSEDEEESLDQPSYLASLPLLQLNWSTRNRLINNLVKNHQLTVVYSGQVDDKMKKELIDENRSLVEELLNLEVQADRKTANCDFKSELPTVHDTTATTNGDKTVDDGEDYYDNEAIDGMLSDLKDEIKLEIDNVKEEIEKQVKEEIKTESKRRIKDEIKDLKAEMKQFAQGLVRCAPEVVYTFKIDKFAEFVANGEKRRSETFYSRGLPWYLNVDYSTVTDSMSVYLHCDYEAIANDWNCKTTFKFILIHHSPLKRARNLETHHDHVFKQKIGYGRNKFATYNELTNQRSAYIKDDVIYLRVELIVDMPNGV